MGALQKAVICVATVGVLGVLSSGCASRLWIASTQFDATDYKNSKIGVLPTVINPAYARPDFSIDGLEKAVEEAFDSTGVHMGSRPKRFSGSDVNATGEHVTFPYTPGQLSRVGGALKLDAALGISIMTWNREGPSQPASVDLIVTFADVASPSSKYWAVAGSWSAAKLADLPNSLQASLGFQFIDVKWYARAKLNPWGSTQVFPPDEPMVILSSAGRDLRKNVSLPVRSIPLVATGIHEGGIASLRVTNEGAKFHYQVTGEPNPTTLALPTFLGGPVVVPLVKGKNTIVVSAFSKDGKEGKRVLKLNSTQDRKIHVVPILVADYKEFSPLKKSLFSMDDFNDAASQNASVDLVDTSGLTPTKYELADLLQNVAYSAGSDDPAVILFSGRIARGKGSGTQDVNSSFFLLMKDSSRGFPGIGSVSLKDVISVTLPHWTVLLDVCSDEDPADIQQQLVTSMPAGSVVQVRSCTNPKGESITRAATGWVRGYGKPRYPQANLNLLQAIERRVPGSVVGAPAGASDLRQ